MPAVARWLLLRCILLLMPLAAVACGGGGGGSGEPVIESFGATPQPLARGESTTLSWNVSGIDQVQIEPGLGTRPARGNLSVTPSASTTYRLRAGTQNRELVIPVYDFAALSATLDSYLDELSSSPEGSRGYVFSLAIAGRRLYTRAGGDFTAGTRVAIASATKAPTAAAILTLVQDGRLDLDRPISAYIPDLWPASGDKAGVTMRMLLNHTSGLPSASECLADTRTTTLEACGAEIAGLPLQSAPGTRFRYGAASYQLAGLIAQRLSGLPWKEFFAARLGTPLGLQGYEYLGDGNPRLAGGAISGVADYLKIEQLFLDGGRAADGRLILSPALAALVRSDQIAGKAVDFTPMPEGAGLDAYSFGWWISDASLHPESAGPELSDPGLFGTVPWIDDDRDYAAVLLLANQAQTGLDLWNAARARILEQLAAP